MWKITQLFIALGIVILVVGILLMVYVPASTSQIGYDIGVGALVVGIVCLSLVMIPYIISWTYKANKQTYSEENMERNNGRIEYRQRGAVEGALGVGGIPFL